MTAPLLPVLDAALAADGTMTIAEYMRMALTHPEHGYYVTQTPFGVDGDFITAPEISQMFGELLGLWCFEQLRLQDNLNNAALMELGPGRGTLMTDILRTVTPIAPDAPWPVHLVEVSPELQRQQLEALDGHAVTHHRDLTTMPPQPVVFIANEFFDALPIRQYENTKHGWRERRVAMAENGLTITTDAGISAGMADEAPSFPPAEIGQIAEMAPDLPAIITTMADHITTYGGAALIIDYGKDNPIGDSLQAVRDHQPVHILDTPGHADLSAWVDFSAIRAAAENTGAENAGAEIAGAEVLGPVGQGEFLKALGLYHRAEQLSAGAEPDIRRALAAAVDRLSSPAQMGEVFKVMAILPKGFAESVQGVAGFPWPSAEK
ncbi:MAG: SAM-dependent methyltransferase [Alphaproteobacteria bacterium]|nr:SAM-dependent methyltransferase [Alphaproteobacteria bacterium]